MSSRESDDPSLYHGDLDSCQPGFYHNDVVCARAITFSALSLLTFGLAVFKFIQIAQGRMIEKYHFAVFFLAALECALLFMHWSFAHVVQLHFAALYLHVNQFLLISVFYSALALKVNKLARIVHGVVYPGAVLTFLYFTGVLVYALINLEKDPLECLQPEWLLFSASLLVLGIMFCLAGIYLTKAMDSIALGQNTRNTWKKFTLWGLIGAFNFAALVGFVFDLVLRVVHSDGGCDAVFGAPISASYTTVVMMQRILTLLLPIWIMAFLLRPATDRPASSQMLRAPGVMSTTFKSGNAPTMMFDDFEFSFSTDNDGGGEFGDGLLIAGALHDSDNEYY